MNFYCIKFSKFKKSKNIKIKLEVVEIINLYFHCIEYGMVLKILKLLLKKN